MKIYELFLFSLHLTTDLLSQLTNFLLTTYLRELKKTSELLHR